MKSSRGTNVPRTIAYAIITALVLSSLGACDFSDIAHEASKIELVETPEPPVESKPSAGNGKIEVIDVNGDRIETEVDVVEEGEAEDNAANQLPEANLAAAAQNMALPTNFNFAYSSLDDSGRLCYREIYLIISEMMTRVELTSKDPDEVDLAFRAVMLDHPEIFYVKGYSIVKYMNGKKLSKIAFSGTYTMSADEVKQGMAEVDAYVRDVTSNCPKNAGDYETIKYVYDYLIKSNEYVRDSENNQNILSVVRNGKTVCQGYTKVMQLLLTKMGIFCTVVNGTACGRGGVPDAEELKDAENAEWGGHVWNIVECNGMYYNVDVTWGDSAITLLNTDGSLSTDLEVNYEFFLVSDDYMADTHEPKPVVPMPKCVSMEDSYYQHEGLYFTQVDPSQFYRAFESSLSSGQSVVYIKASDREVYDRIKEHLFDEQNVFEYIGRTNVRYVEFAERNLMMISL